GSNSTDSMDFLPVTEQPQTSKIFSKRKSGKEKKKKPFALSADEINNPNFLAKSIPNEVETKLKSENLELRNQLEEYRTELARSEAKLRISQKEIERFRKTQVLIDQILEHTIEAKKGI